MSIDLRNRKFNLLTVIEYAYSKNGSRYWKCLCDCGNITYIETSRLTSSHTKSCGCYQPIRNNKIGKRFGRLVVKSIKNRNPVVYNCLCDCGNYTSVMSSNLTNRKAAVRSCGCLQKDSRKKFVSENHWQWRGGVTTKNEIDRHSPRFHTWRKSVFGRDNYTCVKCGQRGGILHPHHIYSFSLIPEYRFDINNGVTLCADCHKKFHSKYGLSYFKPINTIEYLGVAL